MIRYTLLWLQFAEYILVKEDPLFVRGETVDYFGLVLQAACHKLGLPYLCPRGSVISNRLEFLDERGFLVGWRQLYEGIATGSRKPLPTVEAEALAWLKNFQEHPVRPGYAERNSRVNARWSKMARKAAAAVTSKLDPKYWEEFRAVDIDRRLHTRAKAGSAFASFVQTEVRAAIQRRSRSFQATPNLDVPFLYLTLQFTPEISTLTYGLRHEDPSNFIERVAQNIPTGMMLYVKDHTSMVGRRPASFYRRLQKFFNVELVSPRISTFDLIRSSAGIVSVTSTAGWEGFLLGKPVICFGDVFYRQFDNVLPAEFTRDLAARISLYLGSFRKDDKIIKDSVVAFFEATWSATMGDIGADVTSDHQEANAKRFAEGLAYKYAWLKATNSDMAQALE
jgi:hypothetical protein